MSVEFNPVQSSRASGPKGTRADGASATLNGVKPINFNPKNIKLVVGLGNPGAKYTRTYHNAGRLAITILEENREVFGPRCRFFIPETFMNESGPAVIKALREYSAPAKKTRTRRVRSFANFLLVHDDSDLPLGTYRLVFGRGGAGHHGVDSVVRALGTKEFWRLRIGIRPAAFKNKKAGEFVLKPITKNGEAAVEKATEEFLQTFDTRARHAREEG